VESGRSTLFHDLCASVVVFLIAVPLCMGIAIASGVPPAAGLITGIIGGLVVGALGGSPLQVSGPAAGLSVIVWEIVQTHGLSALGPIILIAGLLQVAAGALRVGQWFRAISPAVVYGMLAGIGVLIFAGQFHVMVDDAPRSNGILNLLSIPASIIKGLTPDGGRAHNEAAILGLLTIAILVAWAKLAPKRWQIIPGALVAVAATTALARFVQMPVKYVTIPDSLFAAVSPPTFGALAAAITNPTILGVAAAVAFVASAETLLAAVAVDRMHSGPRANFDRELAAQGLGNALCGFAGALPMTGVIVRSSANVNAGARTRASAILHGVWLLAAVAAVPAVLRMIPVCSLAAILVYTGYKLVDLKHLKHLKSYGRMPVAIYGVTLAGIVLTDLLTGVLIGLGLSFAKLLYKVSRLSTHVHVRENGRVDVYLEGAATFLRLPQLASALERLTGVTELHVHCDKLVYIDHACLDLLHHWREQQTRNGMLVVLEWDGLVAKFQKPMSATAT
jgi:MFS superfamily sulfate permease-like transporter